MSQFDSIFDELTQDEQYAMPEPFADDQSLYEMFPKMLVSLSGDQQSKRPLPVVEEAVIVVARDEHKQEVSMSQRAHQQMVEDFLSSALTSPNQVYPQGSIGQALQDGLLDPRAVYKMFQHWHASVLQDKQH